MASINSRKNIGNKSARRQLTSHYSNTSLFEKDAKVILDGITVTLQHQHELVEEQNIPHPDVCPLPLQLVVSDVMLCNCCQINFTDREEQLTHYRCDWHRYNLHLRLKGLKSVSEQEFELLSGDVSSISGSEEESEDDYFESQQETHAASPKIVEMPEEFKSTQKRLDKIYFKNSQGELLSLYKCLLSHKKSPSKSSSDLENKALKLLDHQKWAVLMVSSGHFAGAIFNGKDVVDHKTFHRYTVRAKRGTAQSGRDGQGNAPKSAGASLRRYNEAALNQEVQEHLANWKSHLDSCSLIFVRIPVANRVMFYGGKNPVLKKDDLRLRVIPFPTRRPTFSEVKRVFQMLSNIECYGEEDNARDLIPLSPRRFYCKDTDELQVQKNEPAEKECLGDKDHHIKKVKEEEKKDIPEDNVEDVEFDLYPVGPGNPLEEFEVNFGNTTEDDELDSQPAGPGNPLEEFEINDERKKKRRKPKTKKKTAPSQDAEPKSAQDEAEMALKNKLFTACKAGNTADFQQMICHLQSHQTKFLTEDENNDASNDSLSSACNEDHIENKNVEEDTLNQSICDSQKKESDSNYVQADHTGEFLSAPIDDRGYTFLHVASEGNHHEMIPMLLLAGADPSVKNKVGKTPYQLGNNEVKNAYRRFMAGYPDKFDYKLAQIPSPLTPEMEALKKQKNAEKRSVRKKTMQEKNKTKKEKEMKEREENEKKERFLNLSDREKRALAAERRILQQHHDNDCPKPVFSRCFQCGADISGKIPFEYAEFKFCSTKCLRDHRAKAKS